ncbi:MAG: hypothetical protein Q8Q24_00320, partial [bacterium]|nr:hypothetical protein [bacterium]
GLGVACLGTLIFKQNKKIFILTAALGISNLITFKLITKEGESLLMFLPWWFIRTMIVVPDRVNWMDLELRREFYLARGGIRATLRIFEYESIAFLIFLVGNLGMRFIGFAEIIKDFWKKKVYKDTLEITLLFTMFTGFIVPIFFVQKGVTYNLIQFMQYFLLIFGFFAAISFYNFLNLFKKNQIKIAIFLAFFALSIPTVIGNLKEFYGKNPLAIVSNQEIEALNFLKSKSTNQDIILTEPFNPYSKGLFKNQPWPIYAWDSTGYVSAYTGRQTYYTDEGQMQILGIKGTEERLKAMKDFFEPTRPMDKKEEFLNAAKISFVYLRTEEDTQIPKEIFSKLNLKQIFKNSEAVIYSKGKLVSQ